MPVVVWLSLAEVLSVRACDSVTACEGDIDVLGDWVVEGVTEEEGLPVDD